MTHQHNTAKSMAFGLACVFFFASAFADEPVTEPWLEPAPGLLIGGQPQPHELVALREAGVEHVFNARGESEFDAWDQAALLETLGMAYHRIPVAHTDDLNRGSVAEFDRILDEIGDDAALLHCASGNRIGALFALRAGWIEGKSPERAMEIGRAHGLTGLEDHVRELLRDL